MNRKHTFRYHRVFFRILIPFLILVGIVLTVTSAISYHMLAESTAERTEITNRNLLTKTSEIVDLTFEHLSESIERLSNNESVISAVVAPDITRVDRTLEIQRLLNGANHESALIQAIDLYVEYDGTIYSTDNQFLFDALPHSALEILSRRDDLSTSTSALCILDGHSYIVRDFPLQGKDRLGVIILHLDETALYELVQGSQPSTAIYVFDGNGTPIFSEAQGLSTTQMEAALAEVRQAETSDTGYLHTSEKTGLSFLYQDSARFSAADMASSFVSILPFLLVLFLVGILYAILASHYAYRPIQEFVASATGSASPEAISSELQVKNEMDYLHNLFQKTISENRALDSTLKNLIPEMESRLIADILARPMSAQYVQEYLSSINSKLAGTGTFSVLAITLDYADTTLSPESLDIYTTEARRAVLDWSLPNCCARLIAVSELNWALLLSAPPLSPREELHDFAAQILRLLQDTLQPSGLTLQAGIGKPTDSAHEIRNSYEDAQQALLLAKYVDSDSSTASISYLDKEYAAARITELSSLILSGNFSDAEKLIRSTCRDILRKSSSVEQLYSIQREFAKQLQQKYKLFGVSRADLVFSQTIEHNEQKPEQLVAALETLCTEYISQLNDYLSKRSNRIVYQATLYLEEHYSNGLLSLNDVAESIGVNSSYLSTLFSSVTGMRFTEYLSKRRVAAAKQKLIHTDAPAKDICSECGFNSVQNFNRVFKQHTGISPGEYRQTHLH